MLFNFVFKPTDLICPFTLQWLTFNYPCRAMAKGQAAFLDEEFMEVHIFSKLNVFRLLFRPSVTLKLHGYLLDFRLDLVLVGHTLLVYNEKYINVKPYQPFSPIIDRIIKILNILNKVG